MENPIFEEKRMERFIQQDLFAKTLFEGLAGGTKTERLEIVFNSVILDDSLMTRSYQNV